MDTIREELDQQPQAMRDLAGFLRANSRAAQDALGPLPARLIFTGMGASYHAAWIAAIRLRQFGYPALSIEAAELVDYAGALLEANPTVVYVSQSGESGEAPDLLGRLGTGARLIAVTNRPTSTLGRAANLVLPLCAGYETLIASKTYLNSLALLWWLTGQWTGAPTALDVLDRLADRIFKIRWQRDHARELLNAFDVDQGLVLCGHGPGAATARHGAMMLAEWAKVQVTDYSLAAFRHGFIEIARPELGVLVIGSARTRESVQALSAELAGYGARVRALESGAVRAIGEAPPDGGDIDEFLSPILDAVTLQEYVVALAHARGVAPGFRHISKVVRKR